MKNFREILDAFILGDISLSSFSEKLDELLKKQPNQVKEILKELDVACQKNRIAKDIHNNIRQQVNVFRRKNESETSDISDGDARETTQFVKPSVDLDGDLTQSKSYVNDDMTQSAPQTGSQNVDVFLTDKTEVTAPPPSTDKTEVTGPSPSIDKTEVTGAPVSEYTQQRSEHYDEGSVIKQRFKLEKVLGVGGMGKVYKALDLLKEEAKDKKPYVAIKLLNEDFKDHPDSFIALQRESSRQQKLAHPNIATVYDFDRVGGPGTPVYITMELMEGMELKDYLRKTVRKKQGLPFARAYNIIRQLGAGLRYAHEYKDYTGPKPLVHSDFKPGNAFLCNDNTVKILDFGIARAVSNPVTGEVEKTLFDAGKLGALTPAYASLEMLQGEAPDVRDDIYALGCTAYELLTGKHPFNKTPAVKALKKGMEPPYIKSLNRKQNRALRRAVAFRRADRVQTVAEFLEELKGLATWYKNPFFIAASVLLVIGLILIPPAQDWLHQQRLQGIVQDIQIGTEQDVFNKLEETRQLSKADQTIILDNAKDAIQTYFQDRIAWFSDISSDSYNFQKAHESLDEIEQFYPESVFLQEQSQLVDDRKKQIISALNQEYINIIRDTTRIDESRIILLKIGEINPSHPLLADPRIENAYRLLILDKIELNQLDLALELAKVGIATRPDSVSLTDLWKQVTRLQRIDTLATELGQDSSQMLSLQDFKNIEGKVNELARLESNHEVLSVLSETFRSVVEVDYLDQLLAAETAEDNAGFIEDYSTIMDSLRLTRLLTKIELAHLDGVERQQRIAEIVEDRFMRIENALADPDFEASIWGQDLLNNIEVLSGIVDENETAVMSRFEDYRDRILHSYISQIEDVIEDERFDIAEGYINFVALLIPDTLAVNEMRGMVNVARLRAEKALLIESNKTDFQTFAEANNLAEAERLFEELRADLPSSDPYVSIEAPRLLADIYARLAMNNASANDYLTAYQFVQKGLEIDPGNSTLIEMDGKYSAEKNIVELQNLFETAETFPLETRFQLSQIDRYASSERAAEFRQLALETLIRRIEELRDSNENIAASLAQGAFSLFPASKALADLKDDLKLKPWGQLSQAQTLISLGKLTEAEALQEEANQQFGNHPDFISFSQLLENKKKSANEIYQIYLQDREVAQDDRAKLIISKKLLERAQALWLDNPEYIQNAVALDELIEELKPKAKPRIRTAEQSLEDIISARNAAASTVQQEWEPIESDTECSTRLAGYGRRAKAICFDMIYNGVRGPLMVVVPSNGDGSAFAIGKYEVSVNDWSKYCLLSKVCDPITDTAKKYEPMTDITLKQAQDYANWLSERTGKRYRLPTLAEWEYAANAQGKQPRKDFNCRVSLGDKLIKGTGIVNIQSGRSNGWGLKNYVGNVQEWTFDENNIRVNGGAYIDQHSKCDISLQREHSGQADDITGFRLVRENIN